MIFFPELPQIAMEKSWGKEEWVKPKFPESLSTQPDPHTLWCLHFALLRWKIIDICLSPHFVLHFRSNALRVSLTVFLCIQADT